MNQDLRQAEKLTLSEKRLLKRHSRSAIAIMAMHTLLCVVYFQFGYFDVALEKGLVMLFVVWASLVAYQLLLATGWTLRLSEPSLSLPLVLHFMVVFMVSGYYVDEFRLSVVTLFFAGLLLVSFRLSGKVMIGVAVLASALAVTHYSHICRQTYGELTAMQREANQLQVEYGRYLLEQSAVGSLQRV
ncbi:MAG: cell division protein FtsL, partial [Alcanivorax sp.]